jgi:hypothetical protein
MFVERPTFSTLRVTGVQGSNDYERNFVQLLLASASLIWSSCLSFEDEVYDPGADAFTTDLHERYRIVSDPAVEFPVSRVSQAWMGSALRGAASCNQEVLGFAGNRLVGAVRAIEISVEVATAAYATADLIEADEATQGTTLYVTAHVTRRQFEHLLRPALGQPIAEFELLMAVHVTAFESPGVRAFAREGQRRTLYVEANRDMTARLGSLNLRPRA